MSTKRLVMLTTIIVGLGSFGVAVWAKATGTDLGEIDMWLGMGMGQLALLIKSPLGSS